MLELSSLGVLVSCLIATYLRYAKLFVHGSDQFLLSREGVTQGDPLPIMLCAVAVLPLKKPHQYIQNCYADNSSCIRKLSSMRQWFENVRSISLAYGYFPELSRLF